MMRVQAASQVLPHHLNLTQDPEPSTADLLQSLPFPQLPARELLRRDEELVESQPLDR